ncbi:MAG: 50S ribosomal protein L18 [Spirochaetes bacterium]|nr:50S ribosomal protein L18 [Spirochaetota bacterium]
MNRITLKKKRYNRRRLSIKRKIKSGSDRLRLCISRSNKGFYCQIIDDTKGFTVISASTLEKIFPENKNKGNIEAAKILGKIIAERAVSKGMKKVVFDRNGYLYHGKIKAFADSARENGLEF